jgi:uncharacterized protein YbcC (UPF0753/DUF2309 family)
MQDKNNAVCLGHMSGQFFHNVLGEEEYKKALCYELKKSVAGQKKIETQPELQFVFCVDIRSEPLRRALEMQGKCETFGVPGHFCLPKSIQNLFTSGVSSDDALSPLYDRSLFSAEELAGYAHEVLRLMDLTQNFAPLVMFCGHKSAMDSSFQCRASASRPGGHNARAMAHILNMPDVRRELKTKGVVIGEGTVFIAGEHNTTTHDIEVFECRQDSSLVEVARGELKKAREKYLALIVQKDSLKVYVDGGLAGNAALVIAPRFLTKGIDLEGRAFLQSYNYKHDLDYSILEFILTRIFPFVQALNEESFMASVGQGLRLTTVIYGPKAAVALLVKKHDVARKIVESKGAFIVALDPHDGLTYELHSDFTWVNY